MAPARAAIVARGAWIALGGADTVRVEDVEDVLAGGRAGARIFAGVDGADVVIITVAVDSAGRRAAGSVAAQAAAADGVMQALEPVHVRDVPATQSPLTQVSAPLHTSPSSQLASSVQGSLPGITAREPVTSILP